MTSSTHTESTPSSTKSNDTVLYQGRKAPLPLNIVVVGCGLGGLAAAYCLSQAGHNVTILESASVIGEVGAGIQVGPNLTRLLIRWGLGPQLKEVAVIPEAIVFRRWKDGERVGWTKWGDTMDQNYGSPYYHIHRADFHRLLYDLVAPHITLRLNSRVVSIDPSVPTLTLASGEIVKTDLIIGADGLKSTIREVVLGRPDKPVPTGDAAYRAIVPTSEMVKDPELKPLVDLPEMTGWIGPGRHIMAYCIRAKQEYNIVALHPDNGAEESWTAEGNADMMRQDYAGWEPRVRKLLALVPSTLSWRLMDRSPLPTWVHPDGRVALLGDACHPMLPYRAQGSAMAVEDAAVLGNLFSRLLHRAQIHPLLQAYQQIRYDRATETQASSRLNQHIFHLPDGPDQEARDASMRVAMEASLKAAKGEPVPELRGNANQWADQKKTIEQFGYDADAVTDKWWREMGESTIGALGMSSKM